ncbi:aminotransferase family protein [Labrys wisconsinensis]|uniref:Adenosylmethionine-8-amino-7-oxononanoate aminotransferase n=1 Tax=Labrys wisconsinensis TaxID=425677 RepID=A0ABU0J8K5_9HYPH|nr:aminotransferase class III-fold pyridoxal phosphate-dependent enzyme [Labrys wisconsinensis]MDQ0469935.1 adenosylmethionine-8-amino-7-oxononanoate aminotransferase [Labrys wisconsinensis]
MKDAGRADWDDEVPISDHDRLDVVSGAGCWIVDGEQRRLFDAGSGHSCVNLGYANEALIEAAARSYRRLAYCSPEHRCRPVLDLSARLSQLLGGGYRLRYAATGGGANELAIEIARRFWLHHGRPGKRLILALDRGYHGSTGSASFASGPGVLQSPLVDRSPEVQHVAAARNPADGTARSLAALQDGLEARIAVAGPDRIAAVLVEPVAFAGGVIVPPAGFLEMLAGLCRRHAILLIVDEVITGFGRSGRWFAFQHAEGVRPDIVTMGKGITSAYFPLSAAAVSEPIHETFRTPGNAMSKVITMAGHPVGCDVALEVIAIMERDGLVERVARNAERHLSKLAALRDVPALRDVRGLGHMWGLEFTGPGDGAAAARAIAERCFAAGVLVLHADNVIRINPPLVATEGEIAFLVETLSAAVRAEAGVRRGAART